MQFFLVFSYPARVRTEFGTKFFFLSFPGYHIPFWLKIMLESGFLIFWNFLLFFSEFSCPSRVWTEFETKIFFSFSAYLIPFWLKILPERGFLICKIFVLFFCNFLGRVEYERNSRLKYFSLFLFLSHPVFAKNNTRQRFFYFLNFFAIFLGIF